MSRLWTYPPLSQVIHIANPVTGFQANQAAVAMTNGQAGEGSKHFNIYDSIESPSIFLWLQ